MNTHHSALGKFLQQSLGAIRVLVVDDFEVGSSTGWWVNRQQTHSLSSSSFSIASRAGRICSVQSAGYLPEPLKRVGFAFVERILR
jgi:hypothetical protein